MIKSALRSDTSKILIDYVTVYRSTGDSSGNLKVTPFFESTDVERSSPHRSSKVENRLQVYCNENHHCSEATHSQNPPSHIE